MKSKIARTLALVLASAAALSLASCACPFATSGECCADGTCETCSQ